MTERSGVVLVVDGGYWYKWIKENVNGMEWWQKHMKTIEEKTGSIIHTTVVDGDPSEFVMESIMEGVTQEQQMRVCASRQEQRVEFYNSLTSEIGINNIDVKMRGYKFQRIRKISPPPATDPRGRCQWFYHHGIAQRGVDVCFCVRVMEYTCGLFKASNGDVIIPTSIVCLTADSDMEPAFESLNRVSSIPVYLAACAINPNDPQKRISRELEAYIPKSNRIFLEPPPWKSNRSTHKRVDNQSIEISSNEIPKTKIKRRVVRRVRSKKPKIDN